MALSAQRQGEIALVLVKDRMRKEGIHISSNMRREIGNRAKVLGLSTDEAMEFIEQIVRELIDEAFAPKQS